VAHALACRGELQFAVLSAEANSGTLKHLPLRHGLSFGSLPHPHSGPALAAFVL